MVFIQIVRGTLKLNDVIYVKPQSMRKLNERKVVGLPLYSTFWLMQSEDKMRKQNICNITLQRNFCFAVQTEPHWT